MRKRLYLICLFPLLAGCVATPASREEACHKQADERLGLYDKPDVYPITAREKQGALTALFDECMREREGYYKREPDTTHAKPTTQVITQVIKQPDVPAPQPPYIPPPPAGSVYLPVTITDQPFLKPATDNSLKRAPANKELESILTGTN